MEVLRLTLWLFSGFAFLFICHFHQGAKETARPYHLLTRPHSQPYFRAALLRRPPQHSYRLFSVTR